MRALTLALVACGIALLEASVTPWVTWGHGLALIGAAVIVLVARRSPIHHLAWFIVIATLLSDVLRGAHVGQRTVLLLTALLLMRPVVRRCNLQPALGPVLLLSVALATAERLVGPIVDGTATLVRSGAIVSWWVFAAAWNIAVGMLALRCARRTTPPLHGYVRSSI